MHEMNDPQRRLTAMINSRFGLVSLARDCLYMGKHAFNNGYYGHAIEWLEIAMGRAEEEGNTTATVDEIMPFYKMAIEISDELKPQSHIEGESSSWVPTSGTEIKFRLLDGDNDDYKRYQALCRGEVLRVSDRFDAFPSAIH